MSKIETKDSSELTLEALDAVVGGNATTTGRSGHGDGTGGGTGGGGGRGTGGGDGLGWLRNLLRTILR